MKRADRVWLWLLLILVMTVDPGIRAGEGLTLSPGAWISLLTISPGEDLHMTFGHSAIRVVDPANGLDEKMTYTRWESEPNTMSSMVSPSRSASAGEERMSFPVYIAARLVASPPSPGDPSGSITYNQPS